MGFESSIGSFIILFHITAAKSNPAVRSLGRIAYHHKAKTLLRHGIPQFAENHNYTCIRERTLPELLITRQMGEENRCHPQIVVLEWRKILTIDNYVSRVSRRRNR